MDGYHQQRTHNIYKPTSTVSSPSLLRQVVVGTGSGTLLLEASGCVTTQLDLLKGFSTRCFIRGLFNRFDIFKALIDPRGDLRGQSWYRRSNWVNLPVVWAKFPCSQSSRCQDANETEQCPHWWSHVACSTRSSVLRSTNAADYLYDLVHGPQGVGNKRSNPETCGGNEGRSARVRVDSSCCYCYLQFTSFEVTCTVILWLDICVFCFIQQTLHCALPYQTGSNTLEVVINTQIFTV